MIKSIFLPLLLLFNGCAITPCLNKENRNQSNQLGIVLTPGIASFKINKDKLNCPTTIDINLLDHELNPNDNLATYK